MKLKFQYGRWVIKTDTQTHSTTYPTQAKAQLALDKIVSGLLKFQPHRLQGPDILGR